MALCCFITDDVTDLCANDPQSQTYNVWSKRDCSREKKKKVKRLLLFSVISAVFISAQTHLPAFLPERKASRDDRPSHRLHPTPPGEVRPSWFAAAAEVSEHACGLRGPDDCLC